MWEIQWSGQTISRQEEKAKGDIRFIQTCQDGAAKVDFFCAFIINQTYIRMPLSWEAFLQDTRVVLASKTECERWNNMCECQFYQQPRSVTLVHIRLCHTESLPSQHSQAA